MDFSIFVFGVGTGYGALGIQGAMDGHIEVVYSGYLAVLPRERVVPFVCHILLGLATPCRATTLLGLATPCMTA